MNKVVQISKKNNVSIGAHPSFKDIENFGRKRLNLNSSEIKKLIIDQYEILQTIASKHNEKVTHIKPHGALNNMACEDMELSITIAKTIEEIDLKTKEAHLLRASRRSKNGCQIAIAYTVWSKKKGGGKLIVKEVFKKIKKSNHLNRLITLSPLTEMARNFHLRNGAKELQVNEKTQNFEYKI